MKRNFKPGEEAPVSGLYELIGPRGGHTQGKSVPLRAVKSLHRNQKRAWNIALQNVRATKAVTTLRDKNGLVAVQSRG
jgi:hypothetical protein